MGAIISDCGTYRYRLDRDLGFLGGTTMTFVMVNPSTADAERDDATIRKVKGFAIRLGARRIIVANLFAFRAQDIRALRVAADPSQKAYKDDYYRRTKGIRIEDAEALRAALMERRRQRGEDQAAAALAFGVTLTTYQTWEAGRCPRTLITVVTYALRWLERGG